MTNNVDRDEAKLLTKGDNNNADDTELVSESNFARGMVPC